MKIENIKINNYGKLKDKEIKLKDGINIINGLNESGKSTLLSYIVNIFYGISKNKDGKAITDYDKYKPWDGEEFSGKMDYLLDNGEKYEIFRDFNKKNPKIYNGQMEDISKEFDIDKKDGNQFFITQTGIDKEMYLSTVVSMQQEVKLDGKTQNILVQKIANLAGTGDDSVSYKKATTKLQDKIRDEIGTNKTVQKPINIMQNELIRIEKEIESIEPYVNQKYSIDNEKKDTIDTISKLKIKREIVSKYKNEIDAENIAKNKVEINITKVKENELKLDKLYEEKKVLENEKDELNKNIEKPKKNNNAVINIIIELTMIILIAISILMLKSNILTIVCTFLAIIYGIIASIKTNKTKNTNRIKLNENENKINEKNTKIAMAQGQIAILEKENEDTLAEINKLNSQIEEKVNRKRNELLEEYKNKVNRMELENLLNTKECTTKIDEIENEIREHSIKLNRLEIEENTILPQLDNLVELKEKQESYKEKYDHLKQEEEIINIALDNLKSAYEEMKTTITPKFTQNLSENIRKISEEKYTKVTINDEKGLIVENKKGEYVEAEQLSTGTIDQLYLSLRLSMIDELSKEKLPIMLDETFAYFDNKRLRNILKYLAKDLGDYQTIIFTCTDRECKALAELGIDFNQIDL